MQRAQGDGQQNLAYLHNTKEFAPHPLALRQQGSQRGLQELEENLFFCFGNEGEEPGLPTRPVTGDTEKGLGALNEVGKT